jgi:hypothetical protein
MLLGSLPPLDVDVERVQHMVAGAATARTRCAPARPAAVVTPSVSGRAETGTVGLALRVDGEAT